MNRRIVRRAPLLALGLVLVLLPQHALAATKSVSIRDNFFDPATVSPAQADIVQWTNTGSNPHTTTSDTTNPNGTAGVALWSSTVLSHNQQFSFTFTGAGKYPYHCNIHPSMKGTVSVAVKASPTSGGLSTTFTITWASALPPPQGTDTFRFDVQKKIPGGSFANWKSNTTALSATFKPSTTGTYQFRARLERVSSTGSTVGNSYYSGAKSITVS